MEEERGVMVAVGGQLRCSAVRGLDASLLLVFSSSASRPRQCLGFGAFGVGGGWVLCVCVLLRVRRFDGSMVWFFVLLWATG